jgi:3-oxoacyl-[acyl-carrier protein] reductase
MAAFNRERREKGRPRRALVLGGSGYVGSAVVRELSARGVTGVFSYFQSEEKARALAAEHGFKAVALDLRDVEALRSVIREASPDLFVHCAAIADPSRLDKIDDRLWEDVMAVNVRSAFVACRELFATMREGGDIVLCVGPDALFSAPSAPHFAASQAALAGFVRAAAHDLGPRDIRINAVAFGILEGGASARLSAEAREEAAKGSALRRLGRAAEAGRAVAWVALRNSYMNGAIIPVTGGF